MEDNRFRGFLHQHHSAQVIDSAVVRQLVCQTVAADSAKALSLASRLSWHDPDMDVRPARTVVVKAPEASARDAQRKMFLVDRTDEHSR